MYKMELQSIVTFIAVTDMMDYRYSTKVHLASWFSKVAERGTFVLFLFYNNVFIRKVMQVHCLKFENAEKYKGIKIADDPTTKN